MTSPIPRLSEFQFRSHSPDGPVIPPHIKEPETGRIVINPEWETAEWEVAPIFGARVFETLIPKPTDL